MRIVLCPYELTRAGPTAIAACLLADEPDSGAPTVATWPPRRGVTPEQDDRPARLLQAWAWAEPFWAAGVLRPMTSAEQILDEIEALRALWSSSPDWEGIAGLADRLTLGDIERDLATGGRSIGARIVVETLCAEWTSRLGFSYFTGEHSDHRRRAREPGTLSIALPVPLGADGELLLRIRREMRSQLDALREALDWRARGLPAPESPDQRDAHAALSTACAEYADRFLEVLPLIQTNADEKGLPLRAAEVLLSGSSRSPQSWVADSIRALAPRRSRGDPPPLLRAENDLMRAPALVVRARLSPWDVSPAPRRSSSP